MRHACCTVFAALPDSAFTWAYTPVQPALCFHCQRVWLVRLAKRLDMQGPEHGDQLRQMWQRVRFWQALPEWHLCLSRTADGTQRVAAATKAR